LYVSLEVGSKPLAVVIPGLQVQCVASYMRELSRVQFLGIPMITRPSTLWGCVVVVVLAAGCSGGIDSTAVDCDGIDAAARVAGRTMATSSESLAQLMADDGESVVIDTEAAQYLADVATYHNALHAWVDAGDCPAPPGGLELHGDLFDLGRPATEAEFRSVAIANLSATEPMALCAALSAEIGRKIPCPSDG